MMITEISLRLQSPDCSRVSIGRIVYVLKMCKVSSCWVPRLLTTEHKKKQMGLVLNFLLRYEQIGPSLLGHIIIGDETRAHYSTSEQNILHLNGENYTTYFGHTVCWQGQLHVY